MYDTVIIGAGPAGLSAALVLGRACRRVLLVDAQQPRNGAAHELHGYLGLAPGSAWDLRARGVEQLARFEAELVHERVISARRDDFSNGSGPVFFVETTSGRYLPARTLLLACGVRDRFPSIPGLEECVGCSVHICPYCDAWEHRGKRLAAIGESPNAAASLGMSLRSWSEQVFVLTNGVEPDSEQVVALRKQGIGLVSDRITALESNRGQLKAAQFAATKAVAIDALFFAASPELDPRLAQALGCALTEEGFIQTDDRQRTSEFGVCCAGDADAGSQLAIVAAAEGAKAALTLDNLLLELDQRERVRAGGAAASGEAGSRRRVRWP